jgi:hypothetical protein
MRLTLSLVIMSFFSTLILYCQNYDSIKIDHIDDVISQIPSKVIKDEYYSIIQAGGLIHKRVIGLIKIKTGGFSSDVIHHDTLIYSILNFYHYKKNDKTIDETFYYEDNRLIKYIEQQSVKRKKDSVDIIQHKRIAYFDNNRLLYTINTINDNYQFNESELIKIKSTADIQLNTNLEFIKEQKNIRNR